MRVLTQQCGEVGYRREGGPALCVSGLQFVVVGGEWGEGGERVGQTILAHLLHCPRVGQVRSVQDGVTCKRHGVRSYMFCTGWNNLQDTWS